MDTHFDITPAEAPPPEPRVEATLEGTEPPPPMDMPEDEPPHLGGVQMEVSEKYDEDELEDIELPDLPTKKTKLKNDDVFAPKVKAVKKEKVKKKRKPPTPEQLERLAQGRQKAFAARALKKKERDELKALEKKVADKKKADTKKQLLLELGEEEIPEQVPHVKPPSPKKTIPMKKAPSTQSIMPSITQEDLMMAVAQGVESYDRKRKAEKVKKKERQELESRQTEIKMKVQRAIDPNAFWDQYLK